MISLMNEKRFQHWPANKLEDVKYCPVCGSENHNSLESGLVDWMSDPPTGFWKMITCSDCGVAFLSPRPVESSIADAYRNYYTHTSNKDDLVNNRLRRVKDYCSEKYYSVANNSGGFADYFVYVTMRILYPLSAYFDAKSRHIFKIDGKPGRLLDIGCGNGEFLRFAKKHGWDVVGIDFDNKAVSEARSTGLDVRLGSLITVDIGGKFDFISLSHVIEHVYNPVELINSCYSLLNEDGVLWFETPNIESFGRSIYSSCWRGYEPPRHLIIFNRASLKKMCRDAGFMSVEQKFHGLSGLYMALTSERLMHKLTARGSILKGGLRTVVKFFRVCTLELLQILFRRRREFLTIVSIRSSRASSPIDHK